MAYALTPRQRELLDFLTRYTARRPGAFPSLRELVAHGVACNTGDAHRQISALVERGHLFRSGRGHARQVVLTGARCTPPESRAPDGTPLFFVPAPHRPTGESL